MKKSIIFVLIAVIVVSAFLSIYAIIQNDASDESVGEGENAEEPVPEPQGRNLSIELEEDLGFSTP